MPDIPLFENTVSAEVGGGPPRADPGVFRQIGEATYQGFGQLSDVAQAFTDRYVEARRQANAADITAGASAKLGDAQFRWSKVADQVAAANGFRAEAEKIRNDALAQSNDPLVQSAVTRSVDQETIMRGLDTRQAAFGLESSARRGALDTRLTQYAQSAASQQNPLLRAHTLDQAQGDIDSTVAAGWLRPEEGDERKIAFASRLQQISAEQDRNAALASHDPNVALAWAQKINDPASYPGLNPQVREQLGYRAELMADRIKAKAETATRAAVHASWQDNLASLATTGAPVTPLSDAQIRAAFPEDADRRIQALDLARDTWHATQAVAMASPKEDTALVQKFAPAGAGFAEQQRAQNAIITAVNAKYDALYGPKADPAGYVLGANPDTRALYDAAQQDPSKTGAAVASLDATYDRLGVPEELRTVLPKDAAGAVAQSIESDPTNAPAKMKALEQQFGAAWPRAWRDIVSVGKLDPSYQAVPSLDNERDGALLARWLAEVPKGKTGADLIGAKPENDIKTAVRSDPTVQSFLSSLSRSGAGLGQVDGVLRAIDDLAFAKSYYDRDPHAAANAIDSFTAKYEFMPDGGARVPRERYDAVSANAAATLRGLALDQIAVPPLFGQHGMPSGDDYLRVLRTAPTWITSPNVDALWLMDNGGRVVRGRDGKPIAVPFAAPPPPALPDPAAAYLGGGP